MGYGPIINGKQTPITPWRGSWAYCRQIARAGEPTYSPLHRKWILTNPDRPELIILSGTESEVRQEIAKAKEMV